jgi:hypothetical protein
MNREIRFKRAIPGSIIFKRKLSAFVWKINDLGLDNERDGIIEQSLLETSYRNLELRFHEKTTGIIVQKNESQQSSIFSFQWELDQKNSFITILSEHPLFCIKTKWKMQQVRHNELQLSYQIRLHDGIITVLMILKGDRIKKRNNARKFLEMVILPLFYL